MNLTRSTTGNGPITNRQEHVLNDVLHWIWSWRAQVDRLITSTNAQGQGSNKVEIRKSFSLASYDEHILIVAGWNLARAIAQAAKLFPLFRIDEEKIEALRLLRHLYEHWDEQREFFQSPLLKKGRSAKRFVEHFPHGRPWSISYTRDDWLLGGIVGIQAITEALVPIEDNALDIEKKLRKK